MIYTHNKYCLEYVVLNKYARVYRLLSEAETSIAFIDWFLDSWFVFLALFFYLSY